MKQTITQETLVLYAYAELNPPEAESVRSLLETDPELQAELSSIMEEMALLNSVMLSPHPTSVQIVLEESSSALLAHWSKGIAYR